MTLFSFDVASVAEEWSGRVETWTVEGSVTLAGDAYEFTYEVQPGGLDQPRLELTLDGQPLPDGSHFERTLGQDAVAEMCDEVLEEVWHAQQEAALAVAGAVIARSRSGVVSGGWEWERSG